MVDPERQRLDELLTRVAVGQATEAERIELQLYIELDPNLEPIAAGRLAAGDALALRSDDALARSPVPARADQLERGVGLGLLAGAALLGPAFGLLGPVVLAGGAGLLALSLLRGRSADTARS